jgi:hypothetical protein
MYMEMLAICNSSNPNLSLQNYILRSWGWDLTNARRTVKVTHCRFYSLCSIVRCNRSKSFFTFSFSKSQYVWRTWAKKPFEMNLTTLFLRRQILINSQYPSLHCLPICTLWCHNACSRSEHAVCDDGDTDLLSLTWFVLCFISSMRYLVHSKKSMSKIYSFDFGYWCTL